jgi:hypothetical protein
MTRKLMMAAEIPHGFPLEVCLGSSIHLGPLGLWAFKGGRHPASLRGAKRQKACKGQKGKATKMTAKPPRKSRGARQPRTVELADVQDALYGAKRCHN